MGIETTIIPTKLSKDEIPDEQTLTYDANIDRVKVKPLGITANEIANATITPDKLSFDTMQKIAEVTITQNVSSVSITGLNIADGEIAIIYIPKLYNQSSTNSAEFAIFFNNDTTSTYTTQVVKFNDATVSSARITASRIASLATLTTGSALVYVINYYAPRWISYGYDSLPILLYYSGKVNATYNPITQIDLVGNTSTSIFEPQTIKVYKVI